jgi:predicted DNA-binding protein
MSPPIEKEPDPRNEAGYTRGMKTAISLPDDLYQEIERLSERLQKPRSQLYVEALREYLARHDPEAITKALNRVSDELNEPLDPFVEAAGKQVLQRVEW